MKIIFFGSSDFAVPVLEALSRQEEVALVVTQPDRKKGRSLRVASTAIKESAAGLGIRVFQPDDVNKKESIECLKEIGADLFVVVSFGQILKRELLDIQREYCLNVHASLLPKYRGAAPVNWAIANGEKETGVTIIKMNERMDEGDVMIKEGAVIDDEDDAVTLSDKLSKKGAGALLKSIDLIKKGEEKFIKQDNSRVTYAPKLKKQDGLIDWNLSAAEIRNRIRAFVPWPGCFTCMNKKILKIWKAGPSAVGNCGAERPGTVLKVTRDNISVSTGEGVLDIKELQLEGRRRMKAEEFIAGHRELVKGLKFTCPTS